MQRVRTDRRRVILLVVIALCVAALLVLLDQISKIYLKTLVDRGEFTRFPLINGIIDISYAENPGAAWSFLADKAWAQDFFKILTSVALVAFTALLIWSAIKGKTFMCIIFAVIIAGAVGNFIDRISYGFVIDFLAVTLFKFPVFNVADSLMFIGIVLLIIDLLFVDDGALFKKKSKKDENS
ncbi:MAG: signal peptidase II [Clostridia bacterium]|nr:signal peptidase II [Clostridia bacterium]